MMKIAIHHRDNSFSDCWISFLKENNIQYKLVDCYNNKIIDELKDCDALLWHHHHAIYKDVLVAKNILFALDHSGFKVFPNFNSTWHFDDKIAQKYLLEAIGAPVIPSVVFYEKKVALNWANTAIFPKVFKLKGGAGASNVFLVKSKRQAKNIIRKAFGKGFSQVSKVRSLKDRYLKFRNGQISILAFIKGFGRFIIPTKFDKDSNREKGYVYFQDFIPNNNFDTRVVVVGNKAAAERRMVRDNDFRASGSGVFVFDNINTEAIKIAFDVSAKLKLQSIAFDFVEDNNGKPLIVEMSYGFGTTGLNKAPGYWDSDLNWHPSEINPGVWIIEDVLRDVNDQS